MFNTEEIKLYCLFALFLLSCVSCIDGVVTIRSSFNDNSKMLLLSPSSNTWMHKELQTELGNHSKLYTLAVSVQFHI